MKRFLSIPFQLALILICQVLVVGVGVFIMTGDINQLRSIPVAQPALDAAVGTATWTILSTLVIGALLMWLVGRSLAKRSNDIYAAFSRIFDLCFPRLDVAIQALANGDLTARYVPVCKPIPVQGNDEITRIAVLHNRMLTDGFYIVAQRLGAGFESLEDIIAAVAQTSRSLAVASDQAAAAASVALHNASAVEEIAQAIELVAVGAQDQASRIADVTTAVEELSRTAEQIATVAAHQADSLATTTQALQNLDASVGILSAQGTTLTSAAREASSQASNGNEAVNDTASTIAELKTVTSTAANAMASLEEQSSQVEEIVDTIEDIADQTNLLALNAAIEAARAGDHGRGFAVVADEVRKLAERSSIATKEISKILSAIKRDVIAAAHAMHTSSNSMDSGITVSERASRSLENVSRAILTTSNVAEVLAGQARDMQAVSTHVTGSMASASAAVEENSAAASEMRSTTNHVMEAIAPVAETAAQNAMTARQSAGSIQQLASGLTDVGSTSEALRLQADQLETLVRRFTLRHPTPSPHDRSNQLILSRR